MLVGNAITGNGTVPAGGAAAQVLGKNSTTDYDLGWTTPAGGGNVSTSGTITTGQYARWASGTTIESVAAATVKSDLVLTKGDVGLSVVTNDVQTKAAIVPNTIPSAGQLMVGNAGGTAFAPVTLTGASLSAAGALSSIANASLANSSITIAGTAVSLGGSIFLNTIMGVTVSTVGLNFLDLVNPGAITFPKITAVNDVVAESAATYRTSLGATTVGGNLFTLGTPGITGFVKVTTISGATTVEDPPTMRTTLGLVIGTNVQAWDTDLDTWASVTPTSGIQTWLATPNSANLRGALTDENGTGAALFSGATSPDFTTGITIGGAAASGKVLQGDGTKFTASTPTWPTAAGTAGKMVQSNGSNFVTTTETYAAPGASGNVMQSDGTNWTSVAEPLLAVNASAAGAVGFAANQTIAGSVITIPAGAWKTNGQYHCVFDMTKTAAGTAAIAINVHMGTLGTTSDAIVGTMTLPAGTAAADTGLFDVYATFKSIGSGTSALLTLYTRVDKLATSTGLVNNGLTIAIIGTASSGFDSTTQTKISLGFNGGATFSGTNALTQTEYKQ